MKKEIRFEGYKKWCLEHHKLPSPTSKDPIEKSLGMWRGFYRDWEPLIEFNKQFKPRCYKSRKFRFKEYKRWCIENQKLPSSTSKDPTEKSLGMWKGFYRNWEPLIEFSKQFESRHKSKESRFEEYKKWCLEHHKLPSPYSKDTIEKSLGGWRSFYRNWDPLVEFSKQFESRHKSKESRFEEYKEWCLEHHKLPSPYSKDTIEKSLGGWRYVYKNWEPLIEFNKQFGPREYKSRKFRFEEYKEWCIENQKLPSSTSKDDPIEKSLGGWRYAYSNWEPLRNFNLILTKSVEGDEEAIEIINLLR